MLKILIPAIFLVLMAEYVWAQNYSPQLKRQDENTVLPDQETFGFDVLLSEGGLLYARVQAKHMVFFKNQGNYLLDGGVKTDFYNTVGQRTSAIFSDSAVIDRAGNRITARSNVIANSDSGVSLSTDILYWNAVNRKIFTDEAVTIYFLNDTLYGMGFASDPDLQNWQIESPRGVSGRAVKFPGE